MKLGLDNTFRVVQLSDVWANGDQADFSNTMDFIEKLLKKEKPDLVVLTGDVVDPAADSQFENLWKSAMEIIKESKTPYIQTGGSKLANVSRADTLKIDH